MIFAAATVLAALFALVLTGALATTASTLGIPESVVLHVTLHRRAGEAAGALAIALLVWMAWKRGPARRLAWMLSAGVAVEGVLGSLPLASPAAGVAHAVLAQVLLAGGALLTVRMLRFGAPAQPSIRDYGWPSLRSLALLSPLLVLVQIALGAAFRQRTMGLLPHVVGAILVSMFLLIIGAVVLQQCKDHKLLAGSGRALMVVTFTQVFLGIAVYTVRALPRQEPGPVLTLAAAHVVMGAVLLAVAAVTGMFLRQNVIPKA
jgi:heme A synthase